MKQYLIIVALAFSIACAAEVSQPEAKKQSTIGKKLDQAVESVKSAGNTVVQKTKDTACTMADASKTALAKTGEFVGNVTQKVGQATSKLGETITKNSENLEKKEAAA